MVGSSVFDSLCRKCGNMQPRILRAGNGLIQWSQIGGE